MRSASDAEKGRNRLLTRAAENAPRVFTLTYRAATREGAIGRPNAAQGVPQANTRKLRQLFYPLMRHMLDRIWIGRCRAVSNLRNAKMDIQRKGVGKKKLIRLITGLTLLAVAVIGISYGLTKLKPAAPGVEMSTLWPDTVKRGPMLREVRGLGTLVPEDTMLITASTEGRVQRILVRPGTPVKADTVVMVLTSPELETQLLTAEFNLKAAEAEYENLKVTLQK